MFTTNEFADRRASRLPRWVPVVAVVVMMAAAAAVIVWRVTDRSDTAASSSATSAGSGPDVAAAPPGLQWRQVNGVRLPFGSDGPARVEGPRALGYSHTPQGAVLAAWQISTRLLTDTRYEQILSTQVRADHAGQQQIRNAVTQTRNLDSSQFARAFTAPAAFRIEYYSPTFARIYFAVPSADGGYDFARRAVLWDHGDWQYQADSGLPQLANAATLTGFTTL